MAGFYALLKQSILDRGITDSGERDEIYAQARQAMIRRLWEIRPRLAEEEIERRIGAFDVAVSDIEGDIMAELAAEAAEPEPLPPSRALARALPPPRYAQPPAEPAYARNAAPAQNGYDHREDRPQRAARAAPQQRAYADRRAYVEDPVYEEPAYEEPAYPAPAAYEARPRAYQQPPPYEAPPRAYVPAVPYNDHDDYAAGEPGEYAHEEDAQRLDAYADDDRYDDDPDYDERVVMVPASAPPQPKLPRPPPGSRRRRSVEEYDRQATYSAPRPREEAEIVRRKPRRRGALRNFLSAVHLSEADKVRVLASAIGLFVVVLVGSLVYMFMPHADDGVTVDIGVRREVSDAATAVRVAAQEVPIDQTFMLFDGRDPTVFETSTDNPVRFNAQTGVVRVSSSTTSPGVKALIGPGLASRLAGREVRVTIVARSSSEAGAATMRFAYQSGVAISYWQTANLGNDFQAVAMIWRVPALRTDRAGDLLVIQPGVPGDGTGADIKSIRIDLMQAQG